TADAVDTELDFETPPQDSIFEVSSHEQLQYAIQHLMNQGITEQATITMTQDFTATGATIYIPMGAADVFLFREV
ncbi:MAG: hypothetical protein FWC66_08955, partial [Oscillospiraceae bacterium]|nr:hypothetical protein [Oscillospiraceae bacterium]